MGWSTKRMNGTRANQKEDYTAVSSHLGKNLPSQTPLHFQECLHFIIQNLLHCTTTVNSSQNSVLGNILPLVLSIPFNGKTHCICFVLTAKLSVIAHMQLLPLTPLLLYLYS